LTTTTLASRLHEAGSRPLQLGSDERTGRESQPKPRIADRTWRTTLDTIKLLGFAQGILIFCAGAIPSPFRLLAFLPAFALAGAAVFQVVWFAVDAFERREARPACETPGTVSDPVPAHQEDQQMLSMPRTA
jgi:hypothetical protein